MHMRSFVSIIFLVVFVFASFLSAQTKPMTNADVVEMVKAGLPESTIILSIQRSTPAFDTSPQALIQLKKDGASQTVLDAILKTGYSESGPAEEDAFGTSLGSGVTMVVGDRQVPLKRMTPTTKTASGKRALPYVGLFMKAETYAVFNGSKSEQRAATPSPEFEIGISSELKIADAVAVVRLESKKSTRRSQVMRVGTFSSDTGFRKKDVIPIKIQPVTERNVPGSVISYYRITPAAPLPPGEYALVIIGTNFYDFGIELIR